jgi:hypothetical protein
MDIAIQAFGLSINVDGTADPDMFGQGLRMSDCLIIDNVVLESINSYDFRDIEANDADLTLTNCGPGNLLNSKWDGITSTYAAAPAAPPTSGPGFIDASGVTCGVLAVSGLAKCRFSKDTRVDAVAGAIIDTATDAGYIEALGVILSSVQVTFDLQNLDQDVVTFDYAKILGQVSVADVGTSTNRAGANFRHAELLDQVGPHVAGDFCDMDLRAALFSQDSLAVAGSGAIDRSVWIQTIPAGNTGVDVDWANTGGPIPFVTAPEHVSSECDLAVEMPIAITTKSATDVAYTKGGVGDAADVVVSAFKDYVG